MTPTNLIIVLICAALSMLVLIRISRRRPQPKPPYFNNEAEWAQNAPSGPLHSIRPTVRRLAYTLSIHRYRDEAVAYVVVFHDHFPPLPEPDYPHRHFEEAVRYAWRLEVVVKEWRDYEAVLAEATQKFATGLGTLQQAGWWVDSRPADSTHQKYYRLTRS